MFNIIGRKYIFLTISAVLVLASIIVFAVFGLKTGIDFKGGTLWQIRTSVSENDIKSFFSSNLESGDLILFPAENQSYLLRLAVISEAEHQKYLGELKQKFSDVEELKFESIGPTIGGELKNKAMWAIVLVILGISIYVAYAFRKVSYPVKSWKYGIVTLITLFHDVAMPVGLFAILGWKLNIEVDTNFVVALLVVMGFSVHDTIVVFDRIRENLLNQRGKENFSETVNRSINQTFARSINTSLTLVLVLVALLIIGPPSLKYFVLAILVGTITGTYSSIFVASPLLTIWHKFGIKK